MGTQKIAEILVTVLITGVITHLFSEKQAAEEYRALEESKKQIEAETVALNNARKHLYLLMEEFVNSTKSYEETVYNKFFEVTEILEESNEHDSAIIAKIDSDLSEAATQQIDSLRNILILEGTNHEY